MPNGVRVRVGETLVGLTGRSHGWLSKVENGHARLERRQDIAAIAEALEVSAGLLGEPCPGSGPAAAGRRSEGMKQERHGHRDQQRRGAADQRLDVQRQPRLRGQQAGDPRGHLGVRGADGGQRP